ncbi:MAG: hypothetical protein IPP90_07140 [Gemmatimonadaceae bacterium]|nr:hypothetical protein [Gemmatimonadaceae bacterium]
MNGDNASAERTIRSRVMGVMVLVAVAAASVIGGVALDRGVLLPRMFDGRPGFPGGPTFGGRPGFRGGPPRGREPSPEMRRRFSAQMAKDLDLTPKQQVQVDSVLTRQMEAIRRATDALRPTTDSITREAQSAMDSILNPTQRAKVKVVRERMGRPPSGRPTSPP